MAIRKHPEFIVEWSAKLQRAGNIYAPGTFDGRVVLPAWLADSAREQADRVFLVLDATPVGRRDLGWAESYIREGGIEFLLAWGQLVDAFQIDRELWAAEAATNAVHAYHGRLNDLAPALHAGGSS